MVKVRNLFAFSILLLFSCHPGIDSSSVGNVVMPLNSLLDEIDSISLYLDTVSDETFARSNFSPKRCKILIRFYVRNNDTIVDFISYDTLYQNVEKKIAINGVFFSKDGYTVQISDSNDVCNGILYTSQAHKQELVADTTNRLQRTMVLSNGKLIPQPPPFEY